ncbi:MAG TPA: DUF975 family protein [Candidatus Cloacimonadota bacterium]|jgi:uncharacterized membrane protein|nr:DUF975 family protein [Candidatus Cloacimonadota bacterium]HQB41672.1 DUF975 family protein [Candidatus Cloacimonadota bacterium]
MDINSIKDIAIMSLKGNIIAMALMCLFILLSIIGIALASIKYPFLLALYFFIPAPLIMGLVKSSIKIVRNEYISFFTIFEGFKGFHRAILAGIITNLYVVLWSLLFIFPGMVARYSYSMTFYLLADNPNMAIFEAIRTSKNIMKEHRMDLVFLETSFTWWMLFGILTAGIGLLWVIPYYQTAIATLYDHIRGD